MLRIDRTDNRLKGMKKRSLADAGYLEREGLQQLICKSPELFFEELGEELLLIGQEIRPADQVDDRIDVLAIDRQGALVVIELKRGSDRYQLLQGVSYAAMISDWTADDVLEALRLSNSWSVDQARERLEEFLVVNVTELNRTQRVILVAEDFDFEVLATAKWLSEIGNAGLRCHRLFLTFDEQSEVLNCTRVFPIAQLEDHARLRRNRIANPTSATDWESALATITNQPIRDFMLAEVAAGTENNLNSKSLIYRLKGKRRFYVGARRERAYVWQVGRFVGDIAYWSERLSPSHKIEPVDGGDHLRFYLHTSEDCVQFKQSLKQELTQIAFADSETELVAQQNPENRPSA